MSETSLLQWHLDTDEETENEDLPWLMNMDEIDATVTKVKVFEGMLPEMEQTNKRPEQIFEFQEGAGAVIVVEKSKSESFDAHPTSTIEETLPELSIFENSLKSNTVLAVLKQDVEWYGTFVVTLLCGRITINGYKVRNLEPLTIYSPKGFNWVVISPKSNKKSSKVDFAWEQLDQIFSRAQVEKF